LNLVIQARDCSSKLKLDTISVIGAYALGALGVYLNNNILEWAWQWNVYWGFGIATLFLILKGRLIDKLEA
jgi:hypothetical protein